MNKSSRRLVISITSDHEKMIQDLLTLISNSKFQRDGDSAIVKVSGTIHFDFTEEEVKIILESAKN